VHLVRSLEAVGNGDFEVAYHHATSISPAGQLASHAPTALFVFLDLVESAVRTRRFAEADAHVAALLETGVSAISPRLALLVGGSAAIAAQDHKAGELFEDAMAIPGTDRWPFDLARVQLAYGEYLRRQRATTDARKYLTNALTAFQGLGARGWVERASQELRASGQGQARTSGLQAACSQLTSQEHEIAMLAAAGMTNKEIGERLFLSHRTVGAHLYRVFPKLGITSRAALRDALADQTQEE
jgi:DNA-binding CsgD family transcriptional regulator